MARDPGQVEEEVVKYFEALFQGRHVGGDVAAPVDSGSPFRPDFVRLGDFLRDVPMSGVEQCAAGPAHKPARPAGGGGGGQWGEESGFGWPHL